MKLKLDLHDIYNRGVDIDRALRDIIDEAVAKKAPLVEIIPGKGAQELIAGVQSAGGRVAVVSGGFHQVIDPLAAGLGLDRWRANTLEIVDGALTGRVAGRMIDGAAKAEALREWAGVYGIGLQQTVAVGDGANDLAMMHATGLAVGFDAKAPVRDEANVIIDVRDLSQVLPLLGLRG